MHMDIFDIHDDNSEFFNSSEEDSFRTEESESDNDDSHTDREK